MAKLKGVDIRRSKKEWNLFHKRIQVINKRNTINSYLSNKINSLIKDYEECPECVMEYIIKMSESKRKKHYVSPENHKILKEISDRTGTPVSFIVDAIIISPIITNNSSTF